jgi:site-specific DNA recombinase
VRAPVVLMIFEDYCLRRLGLGEIINKLNSDLVRYPPPAANPTDEMVLGKTWNRSQLWAMLRNPKYTGYNVWGRHDKRPGRPRIRPREQWVWSATPTHPAIVPRELFDQVDDRAQDNIDAAKEAPATYPTRHTRRAGRVYVLRGRVRCALCGRRMEGTHQKGSNYYRCRVSATRGNSAARVTGHPGVLQIKEDTVLDAVLEFMDRRLFGPGRLKRLRDELSRPSSDPDDQHAEDLERLQSELQDIDQARHRQSLRMEEHDDPQHPVVALAKERIIELGTRCKAIEDAIRARAGRQAQALNAHEIEAALSAVPDLRDTLRSATADELAEILDAFDVTATYDKPNRALKLAATLKAHRPPQGRSGQSPGR